MLLLVSRLTDEGRDSGKLAVLKRPQIQVTLRRVTEANCYRFHGCRPMLFHRLSECEWFGFKGFHSKLPPGGGVAFDEGANFHHFSLMLAQLSALHLLLAPEGINPRGFKQMLKLMLGREIAAIPTMQPIGYVKSPYTSTKEIPKGPGAKHDAPGVLEIKPEFEVGLTDIEGFSHLFVIWLFDRAEGFELIGIPPIDNREHGVFATRSPRRPNPIGLTVVELQRREGSRLYVQGVDMLDGTPILDIKPYLSSVPPDRLRRGWVADAEARMSSSPTKLG